MIELIASLFTAIVSLILVLFITRKNLKNGTIVYFSLLVIFLGLYPLFNYLSLNAEGAQMTFFWAKMVLLVAIPAGPLFYSFVRVFPRSTLVFNKKLQLILAFWVVINIILAFSGKIFSSVEIVDDSLTITPGPAVASFGLLQFGTLLAGAVTLISKYRSSQGVLRLQLKNISIGILLSFSLMLISTVFLPLLFNITILIPLSPLYILIGIVFVFYTIFRHQFLDIKAIVARSVGYVLSIGFFSVVYGVVVYFVASNFFSDDQISNSAIVIFTIIAVLFGFTFQPLRNMFDKISNKIFYRDIYDTQVVLNQLSELLAKTIQLEEIMHRSLDLITMSVKPTKSSFIVLNENKTFYKKYDLEGGIETTGLADGLQHIKHQLMTNDQVEHGIQKRVMDKFDIALVAQLRTQDGLVGYLLLGPKKSGNIYSSQDINLITIAVNELSIAVQNARNFEQIQEFNITLQKKIEDATKRLRSTNEKLKHLDEAKDEFISMASHQLRTPLTSVKGYVSMVLEGDAGKLNPKQKDLLKSAFVSSQRMVYLIADLLNVSRLKTGKFVIEKKEVFLPDVVEGEIMQLEEVAKNRKLELVYKKPKTFPDVMLDETKIRQVIMNFADNAIYYTPSGGTIKIVLEYDKKSVSYKVVDNGIGVPKEEQHKLFSKFYRAGNAKKARPDGTGLGLFMAKKVVVAQEGAIIFDSKPGQGSTFGFTFPRSKVEAKPEKKPKKSSSPKRKSTK